MKKAPTILQVLPWLDSGGVERGSVDIAHAILAAGGRALVAAEPGRLTGELEAMGGALLPFAGRSKNPFSILFTHARQIEHMIREQGVDLVHARSRAPAWSAYLAARRAGVPFVTTYHGAYSQKGRIKAFYNSVMAKGDRVIANSNYTARLVAGRNPEAASRITIVYRGVDMAAFDPAAVTKERKAALGEKWGLDDRPVILLPSRLTRWKGQSFILPVMGAVKRGAFKEVGRAPFQLVLIGDDQGRTDYSAELDGLIADHDLKADVRRVGHCADMPAAYALSDLVIVPSQDAETFGRSAAEGLAMGIPTLVGDLGAQPEIIAPPKELNGTLIDERWLGASLPHGDEVAWRTAIEQMLSLSPEQRPAFAPHARAHVSRHFSLHAMSRQTLAIYDHFLGTELADRLQ